MVFKAISKTNTITSLNLNNVWKIRKKKKKKPIPSSVTGFLVSTFDINNAHGKTNHPLLHCDCWLCLINENIVRKKIFESLKCYYLGSVRMNPLFPLQICLIFKLDVTTKVETIRTPKVKLPRQILLFIFFSGFPRFHPPDFSFLLTFVFIFLFLVISQSSSQITEPLVKLKSETHICQLPKISLHLTIFIS